MAEESGLERTEQATSRRLERARQEGDVPRSRELGTGLLLLTVGLCLAMSGSSIVQQLCRVLETSFQFDRSLAFDSSKMFAMQSALAEQVLWALLPMGIALVIVALVSPALIGGWLVSFQALVPNFERVNPINGIGRMFSTRSLIELVKALGKALIVGAIAAQVMRSHSSEILGLISEPSKDGLRHVGGLIVICFTMIASGLILIIAIDVPYQLYSYANKLKMTRQEVKQENKESNGNPQIKAKIRALQREMARRRMMSKVPTADVVVTNPTHYAVALKYTEGKMAAPVVVAKGMGAVAARIREIAQENRVPLMEAPPLARALYAHAELDMQIPEALYTAVAEVLAYIFQLRVYQSHGGMAPRKPGDIDVPAALDPAITPTKRMMMNESIDDVDQEDDLPEQDNGEQLNG